MASTADRLVRRKEDVRSVWRIGEDVVISGSPSAIRNLYNPVAHGDPDHYAYREWGDEDSKELWVELVKQHDCAVKHILTLFMAFF
jgi:Zn-dependent metalloprotease